MIFYKDNNSWLIKLTIKSRKCLAYSRFAFFYFFIFLSRWKKEAAKFTRSSNLSFRIVMESLHRKTKKPQYWSKDTTTALHTADTCICCPTRKTKQYIFLRNCVVGSGWTGERERSVYSSPSTTPTSTCFVLLQLISCSPEWEEWMSRLISTLSGYFDMSPLGITSFLG